MQAYEACCSTCDFGGNGITLPYLSSLRVIKWGKMKQILAVPNVWKNCEAARPLFHSCIVCFSACILRLCPIEPLTRHVQSRLVWYLLPVKQEAHHLWGTALVAKGSSSSAKHLSKKLKSVKHMQIPLKYAHVCCMQAWHCHQWAFYMEFFTCPQILVNIWPWGLGHRRTQVGGQYIPFETVTNSSNRILVSWKLTKIGQFMCFWHFVKFQGQTVSQVSCSCACKPFRSRYQNTKIFILSWQMPEKWSIGFLWLQHFCLIF